MAKQILNKNVDNVVEEAMTGFLLAYNKYYKKIDDITALYYRGHRKDKVVIVIGGGSGHDPLFTAFTGAGLADACVNGNICASPNPQIIYETAKAVDQGKGVLFIYGNYAGDNLNFDMAEEMCQADGMKTAHVREWDDVASAPVERITDRRGIAGDIYTIKIAGGAADSGLSFEEVLRITEKARDNTFSMGVGISPGTLPGNENPTFTLADDEMEFGVGLHGEAGIERTKMMGCEEMVDRMYAKIKAEMGLKSGEKIAVLVNGLGSTPLISLNLVYFNLYKLLKKDGVEIHDAEVKSYCTTMEMAGFSITLLRLDDELQKYYDMPCFSPVYAKGAMNLDLSAPIEEENLEEFDESDTEDFEITRSKEGPLTELNAEDTRNMLMYVANKIIENKPYLTEIDSAIGDGDHGIGMAGGLQKARKKLAVMQDEKDVYRLFEKTGETMLKSMGGASGVIFGSMFLEGAKGKSAEVVRTEELAELEEKALQKIQERGGASVGDKTMVDALSPAVDALKKLQGGSLLDQLKAAEEAAKQGMEDTKKYIAKYGRAKSLLERAIGHQDAGATSVYIIFRSMREFIEGKLA